MFLRKKSKISKFLLDSFRQNYMTNDPLVHFNDKLINGKEFIGIRTNQNLKIGHFEPGEHLWAVKRKISVYDSIVVKLPEGNSITTLMGIDELDGILRISIYNFLNKSLFSLSFHFPYISPDEVDYLMELIREKYLSGITMNTPDFTRIIGDNNVIILLNNFVSLSYEFIHATPSNISMVNRLFEKQSLTESISEQKRKDTLFDEL